VRRPAVHRPDHVEHQVGHRRRRQDRLVPAGGQLYLPLRPAQPPAQLGDERRELEVGEISGIGAGPGAAGEIVGDLGVHFHGAGGLHPAAAQPGGRGQPGGLQPVLGEAVEQLTSAGLDGAGQLIGQPGEHADLSRRCGGVEVRVGITVE
jgi:hypothetical protein